MELCSVFILYALDKYSKTESSIPLSQDHVLLSACAGAPGRTGFPPSLISPDLIGDNGEGCEIDSSDPKPSSSELSVRPTRRCGTDFISALTFAGKDNDSRVRDWRDCASCFEKRLCRDVRSPVMASVNEANEKKRSNEKPLNWKRRRISFHEHVSVADDALLSMPSTKSRTRTRRGTSAELSMVATKRHNGASSST